MREANQAERARAEFEGLSSPQYLSDPPPSPPSPTLYPSALPPPDPPPPCQSLPSSPPPFKVFPPSPPPAPTLFKVCPHPPLVKVCPPSLSSSTPSLFKVLSICSYSGRGQMPRILNERFEKENGFQCAWNLYQDWMKAAGTALPASGTESSLPSHPPCLCELVKLMKHDASTPI